MQCEAAGRFAEASVLFMQAWHQGQSDIDFCIAAHYVARHQKNPEDTLHWNQVSLSHAQAVNDEQILGFYPSLYLNIGHSFEVLGDLYEAKRYYMMANASAEALADDRYGSIVSGGITEGLQRITNRMQQESAL
jgi:hypothetical protein